MAQKKTSVRKIARKTAGKSTAKRTRKKTRRELYLIDASVYIFRGYYTLPPGILDSSGEPVSAVYGFADFLLGFLEKIQPTHIVACFDESLSTSYRNDIYPDYKANREAAAPELERQMKLCRRLTRLAGVTEFASDAFEADDLIGTAIQQCRRGDFRNRILSSDKDLTQLLEKGDQLWDYARDRRVDPAEVKRQFGVRPDQIAEYLALRGDAVDNIPGIPGIGAQTAAALLQKFGSLEKVLNGTHRVRKMNIRGAAGIADKLEQHGDMARLCLELTRIHRKAPIQATPSKLKYRGLDEQGMSDFFDEMEFGTRLRNRLARLTGKA